MRPVAKQSIDIRPSWVLMCIVWLAHLVAICIALSSNVASLVQGALVLVIGASWLKPDSSKLITGLILHGDGRIEKLGAGDTVHEMVLHPHTTVLPFLIILLYQQKNRLQSLVLLKDSLQAEDYRQLHRWLRWQIKKSPPK